ncbi:MAG: hypothetical protein GYA16_15150 [Spirochaetes bacterium]|nr:hypothetical protein [Spirochaetota bacterium]
MQKIQLNCKNIFVITLFILISGLISCVSSQNVSSVSSLRENDVLLVGKVIIDPPLQSHEYRNIITIQGSTGYIYLYYSNQLKPIKDLEIGFKQVANSIKTENGKSFFVKFNNQPLYFYYGFIMMDFNTDTGEGVYAYLPAGWVVYPQSKDKAIYIGTIKYTRDEFFRITKVEIIDEFDSVSKEFYEKYGNTIKLKKSLLKAM